MTATPASLNAINFGLKDGGCTFSSNYPGFNSHSINAGLESNAVSCNEKIAFERAYGASLAGKRCVVSMKGTGLSSCVDQFLHANITGINGGLVVVLTEDLEMEASPESQDSRPFRDLFGGLWLEPETVSDGYNFAYNAFEWSEKLDQPVIVRLTNNYFRQEGEFVRREELKSDKILEKNRDKYLFWNGKNGRVAKKQLEVAAFVENNSGQFVRLNEIGEKGLISFGNYLSQKPSLTIMSYPFPRKPVELFVSKYSGVSVIESGRPYGANLIKQMVADEKVTSPSIKENTFEAQPRDYLPKLFAAIKSQGLSYLVGDEGLFTNEATGSVEVCLCMGSAVGIAMGLAEAGIAKPFAVTGDGNFLHGGITALHEACQRQISLGVIVIDNSGCQTTGGQKVACDVLKSLSTFDPIVLDYEKTSELDFRTELKKMKEEKGVSVLVVKNAK